MNSISRLAVSTLIVSGLAGTMSSAQDAAQTPAAQPGETPATTGQAPAAAGSDGPQIFASGRHAQGQILGEIDGLVVDGDRLTVKMTLRPAQAGEKVSNTNIYPGMNDAYYEQVYLISGDKKYMLLRDSQGKALTPPNLTVSGSGDVVGIWYGMFPNPPAGEDITLFMPALEPMGPFTVPAP